MPQFDRLASIAFDHFFSIHQCNANSSNLSIMDYDYFIPNPYLIISYFYFGTLLVDASH
jgi:hypothetical protein